MQDLQWLIYPHLDVPNQFSISNLYNLHPATPILHKITSLQQYPIIFVSLLGLMYPRKINNYNS